MSTIIGFLLGLLKNFIFIGFTSVEAFVFRIVWNYLIVWINSFILLQFDYVTHFNRVTFLEVWAFFILIHFIGQFINKVTPFNISVKSKSKSENKNND